MAEDFLGKELKVGDRVVFVQKSYRNLMIGTISKITAKMAFLDHEETNVCSRTTKQAHDQLIKIEKED